MDYITDTLPCNPHYTLDLKNTEERIRATQLLDRMYELYINIYIIVILFNSVLLINGVISH